MNISKDLNELKQFCFQQLQKTTTNIGRFINATEETFTQYEQKCAKAPLGAASAPNLNQRNGAACSGDAIDLRNMHDALVKALINVLTKTYMYNYELDAPPVAQTQTVAKERRSDVVLRGASESELKLIEHKNARHTDLSELKEFCFQQLQKTTSNIVRFINAIDESFAQYEKKCDKAPMGDAAASGDAIDVRNMYDDLVKISINVLTKTYMYNYELEAICAKDAPPVAAQTQTVVKKEEHRSDVVLRAAESELKLIEHNTARNTARSVFDYLRKELNYEVDSILTGTLTWVGVDSYFCIIPQDVDENGEEKSLVLHYSNNFELIDGIPSRDEVFGLALPECSVYRAIRISEVYQKDNENVYDTILVDFGHCLSIALNKKTFAYKLPEQTRIKPAQIIYCRLTNNDYVAELVAQVSKKIKLRILKVYASELVVELVAENNKTNNTVEQELKIEKFEEIKELDQNNMLCRKNTNPFLNDYEENNEPINQQLTQYDWDVLNEEPLGTTNALKAIMGYVPKDEQRICRFYNSKTGNCFKGASCRLEHIPLDPDGYTKDMELTKTCIQNSTPQTYYKKNERLTITPVYIKSLTHFFAHIDADATNHQIIWTFDELSANNMQRLTDEPHALELVIAKFSDEHFYRAQILEQLNEHIFKVFFVDYGNEALVDIKNMYTCDRLIAFVPYQAVLCRIAGISALDNVSEDLMEMGMKELQSRLLDNSLQIKVIDHYEDLVVKFLEKDMRQLPYQLITQGCVQCY